MTLVVDPGVDNRGGMPTIVRRGAPSTVGTVVWLLRVAWVNLDALWAGALVVAGVVTLVV